MNLPLSAAAGSERRPDRKLGTTVIETYFIEELVGWGGSSKVYRAKHLRSAETVALKVMRKGRSVCVHFQSECIILHRT